MKGYFITDQGQVRSVNEDDGGIFFNTSGQMLIMVADGMGGHKAGEVASQLAVTCIQQAWQQVEEMTTPKEAEAWLEQVIDKMNQSIYARSQKEQELEGMGTTVVLSVCLEESITIAHIGDSRAYLFSDNEFKQLTNDHSLVNELIRTGQITKGDAEQHPRKNVLVRAVGTDERVNPDIGTVGWSEGDCLLLCSDGLTNKVSDEELTKLFQRFEQLEEMTKELIHLANERGGEDNITLAIGEHSSKENGDAVC